MKKLNSKGFLLVETLVVATFCITVLVILFLQFKNLVINYNNSFKYNTVEGIYTLNTIKKYLNQNNITPIENGYKIITEKTGDKYTCQSEYSGICDSLVEAGNFKTIIYTDSELNNLKNSTTISKGMQNFIKQLTNESEKVRLIAEYLDGTFASIVYKENTCSNVNNIIINYLVTSGDGLYTDSTERGRYVYKGANPNNYITIADEEYRIMSIENDGTIKVIKNKSIGDMVFDPGYETSISGITNTNSNNGTRSALKTTDYCYRNVAKYPGCKVWSKQLDDKTITEGVILDRSGTSASQIPWVADSTVLRDLPTTDAYLNTYLNNTYLNRLTDKLDVIDTNLKNKIVTHTFNVGPVKSESGQTLETDIEQESAYKWKGKVGLMTVTDYVKTNTNIETCGTVNLSATSTNAATCKETNYLVKSFMQWAWTISPRSASNSSVVWRVGADSNHNPYLLNGNAYTTNGVYPVLYLSSDICLTGSGANDNPYKIQ